MNSKLVILVSPLEISKHPNEDVFREIFDKHLTDPDPVIIGQILKDENIPFFTQTGTNEIGETLLAYLIDYKPIFGIRYIDNNMSY